METMNIAWYNNLDVVPFVQAIKRQRSIYREKGIDMLKEAISPPAWPSDGCSRWLLNLEQRPAHILLCNGCAWQLCLGYNALSDMITDLKRSQPVMLIGEGDKDLYRTIKDNLVGGPSIVFHRYHEAGVTKLRERELGEGKLCQQILGVDANALYLWCMMQNLPTGIPSRLKAEDDFEAKRSIQQSGARLAVHFLPKQKRNKTPFNGGETRFGKRRLAGWVLFGDNEVYQFHGCYWHGHK